MGKIKGLNDINNGVLVKISGIVKEVDKKLKTNNEPYIYLTLSDETGEISFPIWELVESRLEVLKEGIAIAVYGTVTEYNGTKQIRVNKLEKLDLTESEKLGLVPSYEFNKEYSDGFNLILSTIVELKESYKQFICSYLGINKIQPEQLYSITRGVSGEKLLDKIKTYISEDSKLCKLMLTPAAVHHHQNKIGGCLLHTVGVLANTKALVGNYSGVFKPPIEILNPDRLYMCAILHDIEKIQEYEYYPCIKKKDTTFDHRLLFMKESELVNSKLENPISKEELDTIQHLILTHHGMWSGYKPKTLEEMILFASDLIDANVSECVENNTNKVDMKLSRMIDAE